MIERGEIPERTHALLHLARREVAQPVDAEFLDRECGRNSRLRQRMARLLKALDLAESFLDPRADVSAESRSTTTVPTAEAPCGSARRGNCTER